jgi:hypothetical protein
MSQNLNSIPAFDGKSYGYWKARMRFFLKSINRFRITKIEKQLLAFSVIPIKYMQKSVP